MIIQHTTDNQLVLFTPEDLAERKKLEAFPGLSRQGLQFYCPSKQHLVYNLYQRLRRKIKSIKYTPSIKEMIEGDFSVKEIPSWFKFHTQPLAHQLIALRFAYTFGSFLNLSEPGLGKTKVTLDYIWLIRAAKSLIVCPKSLRFVWETEALKHRPELSVYVVETTDWEKELPKVKTADVIVINYDKAVSLLEPLKALQFDFIAVDEGLIKNPATERTKALTALSRGIKHRCIMSGTLVNNSPLDVFAPLRFIEPSLVGESFTKFRDEYALMVALGKGGYGPKIVTGFKHKEELKEMLACCGVILTKKEWLTSLPPKEFIRKYVTMADQQREYYQDLASNFLLQIPEIGEIEVDNALSVLIKLNQISNGFIYYKENTEETLNELYGTESRKGSKGVRKTFFFKEQPKAKALIELVQSEEFNSPCDTGSNYNATNTESTDLGQAEPQRGRAVQHDCGNGLSCQRDTTRDRSAGDERDHEYGCSANTPCNGTDPHDSTGLWDSVCPSCNSYVSGRSSDPGLVGGDSQTYCRRDCNCCESGCDCGTTSGGGETRCGSLHDERGSDVPACGSHSACRNAGCSSERAAENGVLSPIHGSDKDCISSRRNAELGGQKSGSSVGSKPDSDSDRVLCRTSKNQDRRAIIWFNLDAERDIIQRFLTEAGLSFDVIAGGTKNIGEIVRRFNEDPTIRFLVCQAKTINYGVTIMGTAEDDLADDVFPEFDPLVSDEIFYSLNFSLEVFLQQQDRIHRIGQVRKCRYWLLLTNSKIERRIADRLEEKLICNKEILVDIITSLDKDMIED